MTDVDDLVTWLRAQLDARERELDEDKRVARALAGATRFVGRRPDFYGVGGPAADDYWDHFDPARTLREVETGRAEVDAKRRILDAFEQREAESVQPRGQVFGHHATGLLLAIRILALPLADRPGYREDWRP